MQRQKTTAVRLRTGAATAAMLAAGLLAAGPAWAQAVTVLTDTNAGGLAGTGAGDPGDLRSAILGAGSAITFPGCTPAAPCVINLGGPLPPIMRNLTIDGGAPGAVILDGSAGNYRAFFVDTGVVTLRNLTIRNVSVVGGAGGDGGYGGGGGLGAGAALFVNGITAPATVTLDGVRFENCSATGGAGGTSNVGFGGGGGGGLAFGGGAGHSGGGGGGGVQGAGGAGAGGAVGGIGGVGGGAGGGGGPGSGVGGGGYAGNPGGGSSGSGGNGGFGGGGGGIPYGGLSTSPDFFKGGFGGGGGGALNGGRGGFGGGAAAGSSGGRLGGVGFASSGSGGGGGGGAAGACVFVNQGDLLLLASIAPGAITATGGAPGGAGAGAGTADPAAVYLARGNDAGTLSGSVSYYPAGGGPLVTVSTQGGIADALPTPAPAVAAVPTLTEWAMILLGLMLGGFGLTAVLRRRSGGDLV